MSSLEHRLQARIPDTGRSLSGRERQPLAAHNEKVAYAAFLKARNVYLRSYQLHKIPLAGRLAKAYDKHTIEYQRAAQVYLAAYRKNHRESRTKARKALIESQTIAMARYTNAGQFWGGKALKGALIDIPQWVLLKIPAVKNFTESLNRSPSKKILTAGVLLAAATALGAAFVPTMLALGVSKFAISAILLKRGIPSVLSRKAEYQQNPEKLAKVRWLVGWVTVLVGGAVSWEVFHGDAPEGVMKALHMDSPTEHVDETARHMAGAAIEQKRGTYTFLSLDDSGKRVLESSVNTATLAYDSRALSPDFNGMYERLISLESHRPHLLNTLVNRDLVVEGTEKLRHLRVLEEARFHGAGDGDIAPDLNVARAAARDWNTRFDQAVDAAAEERDKGLLALGAEYANTLPAQKLPPLQYFMEHPAVLSELPITRTITPEDYAASVSAVSSRLSVIDQVIRHYERVIGAEELTSSDHAYGNLITAREHYQGLLSEMRSLRGDFAGMPQGHVVSEHNGTLYGTDLKDSLILDRVRGIDFSHYESAWRAVQDAEAKAESIPFGHTMVDGQVTPLPEVIRFKSDARFDGLSPFMGHALAVEFGKLQDHGVHASITEGFSLSYLKHVSECHGDGTCVDFKTSFSGKDIYEVFDNLGPDAKRLILEARAGGERSHLEQVLREYLVNSLGKSPQEADAWIRMHAEIKTVPWATGDNFHFEPKGGDLMPNPVVS